MSSPLDALGAAAPRQPFYRRRISCEGFIRDDGLWDIDAHLLDTRAAARTDYDGQTVPAGAPLHQMVLRVTLDAQMTIVAARAVTLEAPMPECPNIAAAYASLVGLRIGPGFLSRVREMFKGAQGCTHLTEIMSTVATTAFQTAQSRRTQTTDPATGERLPSARMLDSCHAFRRDGQAVLERWPSLAAKKT